MTDDILKYFAVVVVIGLLFAINLIDNSVINIDCSITGINYVDVSPSECWASNINETFCPLPENIECSGQLKGLSDLINNIGG